ncbi:MAG: fumarylacetoacetate hydrolase family protein [Chloroflexi bacterium]|nr:fumarylacetoacetate hydrolase family protein [Chloroflexota bacterium]MBP8056619.1 fumarylacetoacetate hydrolase family protein [Chloroflexota bacterium]
MRLISYQYHKQNGIGAVLGEQVIDLTPIAGDMVAFIEQGAAAHTAAATLLQQPTQVIPLADVTLLAPIPRPRRNIFCLGLNYVEHAAESYTARGRAVELPDHPIIFTKATNTVIGPEAPIPYDPTVTTQLDWEVELGVIIGQRCKNVPRETAMSVIFGYTIINDVSARDLQRQHKQFHKGKSLDGTCPMGPWIVTTDEIPDPQNLRLTCRVNGIVKQDDHTSHMLFNIATTIAILSHGMTLEAGDVIATGTPAGVGFARTPPEFMVPGDVLESEIEQIGLLRNHIRAD